MIRLYNKYRWHKALGNSFWRSLLLMILLCCQAPLLAQIGIQTDNPDGSAALDIVSSDKGLLIPRVSLSGDLSSPSPVSSPATGLLIYNSGTNQQEGFYFWNGASWQMLKPAESSDVQGPASSTDNAVARFDGISGSQLQNSSVILDDNANVSGVNKVTTSGFTMPTNAGQDKVLISDANGNASWDEALPLDIEKDDFLIVDGVNVLNFEGAVEVIDNGNNKSTVTVTESISEEEVMQLGSTSNINLNYLTGDVSLPWDVEMFKDTATFVHSNTSNPSRIQVKYDGTYELNYMFSIENDDNQRKTLRSRLRKNGTTYIQSSSSYSFTYSKSDDKSSHISSSFLVDLNANDYIEVMVNGQTNSGDVLLIPNENLFFIRIMRSW
ncbi:MAG: hypothetical protein K9G67_05605 [Bacteroidales bacterium]|nr:hypothetical protein [Bacteroidales bacterium]MCF8350245.1 hypothetical protein [Bacteroidales bacterium]MCF8375810.1 hypothetical protein [Bacteroidales bacterium]MCF8401736.1 hypothetical protein [Bacteroidales bacterium]